AGAEHARLPQHHARLLAARGRYGLHVLAFDALHAVGQLEGQTLPRRRVVHVCGHAEDLARLEAAAHHDRALPFVFRGPSHAATVAVGGLGLFPGLDVLRVPVDGHGAVAGLLRREVPAVVGGADARQHDAVGHLPVLDEAAGEIGDEAGIAEIGAL